MMSKIRCFVLFILLLSLQSEDANGKTSKKDSKTTCPNTTDMNAQAPDLPEDEDLHTALWTIVSLVSLFCNVLIIHVVRVNSHMHTTTNYLIVNMALGDIIATVGTVTGSLKVLQVGYEWRWNVWFGKYIFCRIGCSTFMVSMLCSIYSLIAITLDRFLAVTQPLKHQNHSSWNKYIIPGIWVASLVIPANYAINKIKFCTVEGTFYCFALPSRNDAILILIVGFAIPQVVMVTMYMVIAYTLCKRRVPGESAQKTNGPTSAQNVARKVTCMIVCIFVAFEISWYPAFLGYILPFWYRGKGFTDEKKYLHYKMLIICNGITNAIIYAVFNDNFKKAFQEALRWNFIKSGFRKMFGHSKKKATSGTSPASKENCTSCTTK